MKPNLPGAGQLQAAYSVTGSWPQYDVIFESGDGRGRNSDYKRGVETVLSRLGARRALLLGARISSEKILRLAVTAGLEPQFSPKGFAFPLSLNGLDVGHLRRALGNAGALVGSKPGSSGNTTRRMTLSFSLPLPATSAADLEAELAADLAPKADWSVEAVSDVPLVMVGDLATIDEAMAGWRAALEAGSRSIANRLRWLPAEAIMMNTRPSAKRTGALDVELGVRASGAPWTVEINAPKAPADANGLASIARDVSGRLFLVRQGRLRANSGSNGDVREAEFQILSGLSPAEINGGDAPRARTWYVVADLSAPPDEVRRSTADFVHSCARARLLTLRKSDLAIAPPTGAADEKGGVFFNKAVEAQPEKEVRRLQGEVWLALRRVLERASVEMVKLRHQAGYEVDGIILTQPSAILLEIKTSAAASDVYEGVGQLLIYSRLLGLEGHRRVLLLPFRPNPALVDAAEHYGLSVHYYRLVADGASVSVEFSRTLLVACGIRSAVEDSGAPDAP